MCIYVYTFTGTAQFYLLLDNGRRPVKMFCFTVHNQELVRGVAGIFQRGCLTEIKVSHQIFMSFLSPVVGCLLKTWLTKGAQAPQDHPPPPPAPATPLKFS